jgi:hypothetical protein
MDDPKDNDARRHAVLHGVRTPYFRSRPDHKAAFPKVRYKAPGRHTVGSVQQASVRPLHETTPVHIH